MFSTWHHFQSASPPGSSSLNSSNSFSRPACVKTQPGIEYGYGMRTPIFCGVIKRRFMLNYRADPKVVKRLLPAPFSPKLYHGYAIVGVCLVRLESLRPRGLPACLGVSSENAVHRIASEWIDSNKHSHEGIFVARRDTDLWLRTILRGSFSDPGYHRARFAIEESAAHAEFISTVYETEHPVVRVHPESGESSDAPDLSSEPAVSGTLRDTLRLTNGFAAAQAARRRRSGGDALRTGRSLNRQHHLPVRLPA